MQTGARNDRAVLFKFGAAVGLGLVFTYALAFALYAVVRATLTLASAGEAALVWPTATVIDLTLVYLALMIAVLLALGPALTGGLTAWLLAALSARWNPRGTEDKAFGIGFGVGLVAVVLFHAALRLLLGPWWSQLNWEAYLFWFGLPSNLYLMACVGMALRIR